MKKVSISIFGATGSVGTTTLDIIRQDPDKFKIKALTSHGDTENLISLAREFNPEFICIGNTEDYKLISKKINSKKIKCLVGREGLLNCAKEKTDVVVAGIVGLAGLEPLIESIKNSKTICIANKECFVSAGSLIMREAKLRNVKIIPLDSEHSAIFQILESNKNPIDKVYLTASGGPFYGLSKEELLNVTPSDAIKNPNWKMGKKISVDSATLMNKGLEIIEAKYLFDLKEEEIKVLIHRQSIAHGIVSFKNKSILGSFGEPDMKHPIKFALYWPHFYEDNSKPLNIEALSNLTFENINEDNFHALRLVRSILRGNEENLQIILNAANELAVRAFLDRRINFLDILVVVEDAIEYVSSSLGSGNFDKNKDLEYILDLDNLSRVKTEELISQRF